MRLAWGGLRLRGQRAATQGLPVMCVRAPRMIAKWSGSAYWRGSAYFTQKVEVNARERSCGGRRRSAGRVRGLLASVRKASPNATFWASGPFFCKSFARARHSSNLHPVHGSAQQGHVALRLPQRQARAPGAPPEPRGSKPLPLWTAPTRRRSPGRGAAPKPVPVPLPAHPASFRVAVLGAAGAGKTVLVARWAGRAPLTTYETTLGAAPAETMLTLSSPAEPARVTPVDWSWDAVGTDVAQYWKDTNAILLVFSRWDARSLAKAAVSAVECGSAKPTLFVGTHADGKTRRRSHGKARRRRLLVRHRREHHRSLGETRRGLRVDGRLASERTGYMFSGATSFRVRVRAGRESG